MPTPVWLVDFDPSLRSIIVKSGVSVLDIRKDVYSAWKEWARQDNNLGYLQALLSIGGEPLVEGLFSKDYYFLINDWKIQVNSPLLVSGVVYSLPSGSPYSFGPLGSVTSPTLPVLYSCAGQTVNKVLVLATENTVDVPVTDTTLTVQHDTPIVPVMYEECRVIVYP